MNSNSIFSAKRTMMQFVTCVVIGMTSVLASCSKSDDPNPTMPDVIAFSVVDAALNVGDVDFFFDNQQVNSNGFGYLKRIGYYGSYAGNKRLEVRAPGLGRLLLGQTVVMEGNTTYSIYIAGKKDSLQYVITKDDLTAPAAGKAKVRFVNLSPGADEVAMGIAGSPALFAENVFKFSDFKEVDAGTVTLDLRRSTGVVTATLPGVKLESGKIYTIYARGLVSETTGENKFGIEVINNL